MQSQSEVLIVHKGFCTQGGSTLQTLVKCTCSFQVTVFTKPHTYIHVCKHTYAYTHRHTTSMLLRFLFPSMKEQILYSPEIFFAKFFGQEF